MAADFKGCELIVYKVKLTEGEGKQRVTVRECGDKKCYGGWTTHFRAAGTNDYKWADLKESSSVQAPVKPGCLKAPFSSEGCSL